MPEKYSERPPSVDAIQFINTSENAFEINAWLSNYGFVVMYDAPRSRMIIQTPESAFLPTVVTSDWITLNPDLVATVMKDSDFQMKYEAVDPPEIVPDPEPDPTPEEPPAEDPPVEDPPVEDPPA